MRCVRVRVTVEQYGTDVPAGTAAITHDVTDRSDSDITAIASKSAMVLTMGILTNNPTTILTAHIEEDHEHRPAGH